MQRHVELIVVALLQVKVYVNEAHYFNDAVMFTSIWSSPARAKGSRRRKHGLSSQAYGNQSNTCALQLEQESAQPFSQSAMHGFVYPGDCENATEAAEGQIFGLVSSANAPVQLASSTVQVDCAAASTGLLLARRLWQEVVAVSAGHAQTKLEVLDHET